ncbi:MAG: lactate racemase [Frankiales bacterium]|nr:lactate racemase [Frankiales bacterium]
MAYAGGAALIDVPDGCLVLAPADPAQLADPERAVREAVRPWLRGVPPPAVLVLPDNPSFPQSTILPGLLSELARVGLRREVLTVVHGPGLQLDSEFTEHHPVSVHDTKDLDAHEGVGDVDGVPVYLDRAYVDATTRITVGLVEPHQRCGFTGGPETICPGIAGHPTVSGLRARTDDPKTEPLLMRGNPVHDFIRAAVKLAPPRLSLDVTIDGSGRLTGVWCGPLPHSHQAACAFVEQSAVVRVTVRADVVVTAGDPVAEAVASAERAVRPGGTIVVVAESRDEAMTERARVVLSRPEDVGTVTQSLSPSTAYVLPRAPSTVVMVGT